MICEILFFLWLKQNSIGRGVSLGDTHMLQRQEYLAPALHCQYFEPAPRILKKHYQMLFNTWKSNVAREMKQQCEEQTLSPANQAALDRVTLRNFPSLLVFIKFFTKL